MNFQEFQSLDEKARELAFWIHSEHLAERHEPGLVYQLFQLDAFYIEVRYSTIRNTLEEIVAFETLDLLEPYLDAISIEDIFDQGVSRK
jgi:hypothetical protein